MTERPRAGPGTRPAAVARERLALTLAVGLYLVLCRTRLYSGDGVAYADQATSGLLLWNPNHLLMNPIAHAWTALVAAAPGDVPAIVGLKVLSGLVALASVLLFHRVLLALPVASAAARVGLALGFFFSRSMLSMAVSEEFFVVQMPLLVLVLGLCLEVARDHEQGREPGRARLLAIGALTGLATCVAVNNAVLIAGIGAWAAGLGGRWRSLAGLRQAATIGAGSAAVLLPAFTATWAASDVDTGLLRWLLSYQGEAGSEVSRLYGFTANARDAVVACARLAFGFVNNLADGGGAGTLAKGALRGGPLEHVPNHALAALGALALLVAAAALASLLVWMARRRRDEIVLLSAWWIAGYLAFNLFWDNSDDQFWFALLPILWVCASLAMGFAPGRRAERGVRGAPWALAAGVGFLLAANTTFVVAPFAFVDIERGREAHRRLLSPGAVEIHPGWDHVTHLFSAADPQDLQRIALLDVALGRDATGLRMEDLPRVVEEALRGGRRVIVARLYDLDRFPNPWENLARLDWPRARIQALLAPFPSREIARIDGLVFRELTLPPADDESAGRAAPGEPPEPRRSSPAGR